MRIIDKTLKKTIRYKFRGHNLSFKISQMLFSSQAIDHGTHHLLRTLETEKINTYSKVLDLGCGYGPIGIALKKFSQTSEVHMVDVDALSLDYSKENAELNGIKDIKIYGSLGYDDVIDTDFDLVVSNIPAKIGEKALAYMLQEAQFYLIPNGGVVIVVIDAIVDYVTKILTTDPTIRILFQKKWPGYTVFHYEFTTKTIKPRESALERGIFDRCEMSFKIQNTKVTMKTVYGLSEFSTFDYETQFLIKKLKVLQNKPLQNFLMFHPGQGHIPVIITLYTKAEQFTLAGRNLLALRNSKRNMILNGYKENNIVLRFQSDLFLDAEKPFTCIVCIFPKKDNLMVHLLYVEQATSMLNSDGIIILASSSTVITRLERIIRKEKNLKIRERQRFKGNSIIFLDNVHKF